MARVPGVSPGLRDVLLSFTVVTTLWVAHKWLFARIDGFSPRLLWLNFVCLLGIILVPFTTRVFVEDSAYQISAVLFGAVVGSTGLAPINTVRHCRARGLLRPDTEPDTVRRFQLFLSFPTAAFLLSVPIAFVNLSGARYSWVVAVGLTAVAARWMTHPGTRSPGRPTGRVSRRQSTRR